MDVRLLYGILLINVSLIGSFPPDTDKDLYKKAVDRIEERFALINQNRLSNLSDIEKQEYKSYLQIHELLKLQCREASNNYYNYERKYAKNIDLIHWINGHDQLLQQVKKASIALKQHIENNKDLLSKIKETYQHQEEYKKHQKSIQEENPSCPETEL